MDRHGTVGRIAYKFYALVRIYDTDARKYIDRDDEITIARDNWSQAHTALYKRYKDQVVSSVTLLKKEKIFYWLEDDTFYQIAHKRHLETETY